MGIEPTTSCSVGRRATIAPVRRFSPTRPNGLHTQTDAAPRQHQARPTPSRMSQGLATPFRTFSRTREKKKRNMQRAPRTHAVGRTPPGKEWQHATPHHLEDFGICCRDRCFLTAAKSRQKSRSDEAASAAAHWVESALWSALCWPDLRTDAPAGKVGTSDRVASSPRPEFWKRVR